MLPLYTIMGSPRNAIAGGETLGAVNLNAVNAADIPVFVSAKPSR